MEETRNIPGTPQAGGGVDLNRMFQQALALHKQGHMLNAEQIYGEVIARDPHHFGALHLLGVIAMQTGRSDRAVELIGRAIRVNDRAPAAHSNHGNALQALKRYEEALVSYDKAISFKPDFADAYLNRGIALQQLKRLEGALASYDKAISLKPDCAEAHLNRGIVLKGMRRFDDALASFDKAILLKPCFAEAYNDRGNALYELDRIDDAVASYGRAVALKPDYAEAYKNCGIALQEQNRLDEALRSYDKAASIDPDYAEVQWNKSLLLLTMGRFDVGWQLYEWRKRKEIPITLRSYPQATITGGDNVTGKTVFLHWEQGIGDTIHFCRYAKRVQAQGARVIMSVQNPLVRLLKQLEPQIEVIGGQQEPASFDVHCPLMSLPLAFGTRLETIPSQRRYLFTDPDTEAQWTRRLLPKKAPRIGLAWRGSTTHKNDLNRSMALSQLTPLLSLNAEWCCLQKEIRAGDVPLLEELGQINFYGEELRDFADTAALISQLDLVVSVDTGVAHLTGALGKPVWLLLPFMPDWRWLLDRTDSPWYPSARLFRQPRRGDWRAVVDSVKRELETWLGSAG